MRREFTLAARPDSVRSARRFVTEALQQAGAPERWATVLLTSELVTNVLKHTDSEIRVTLDVGPPIRVEVHDGVAATEAFEKILAEAPVPVEASAISGRGIELLHLLASRIGLNNNDEGGKVVWFELTSESVTTRGSRSGGR
jgi:anti-sigma regulatory factor (Ser/Thr protein kinase)